MNIEHNIDLELDRLRKLAWRMDAIVTIPRLNISVGLDTLLGFIPVVGDVLTALPGLWMVARARRLGASPGTLAYMVLNIAIDTAIGALPIVGDIFDMFYCANIRNFNALSRDLNRKAARAKTVRTAQRSVTGARPALLA